MKTLIIHCPKGQIFTLRNTFKQIATVREEKKAPGLSSGVRFSCQLSPDQEGTTEIIHYQLREVANSRHLAVLASYLSVQSIITTPAEKAWATT